MNYALINNAGEVLEISKAPIPNESESFRVVKLRDFDEGDEVNFYIIVLSTTSVDGEDIAAEYSAVKQSPYVASLLSESRQLRDENKLFKQSQADQDEAIMLLMLGGI